MVEGVGLCSGGRAGRELGGKESLLLDNVAQLRPIVASGSFVVSQCFVWVVDGFLFYRDVRSEG